MARRRRALVSEQLRQAIRRRGESLLHIAGQTGVDDGSLSRFMRAQRGLTTKSVDRLCKYLSLELRESKQKGR